MILLSTLLTLIFVEIKKKNKDEFIALICPKRRSVFRDFFYLSVAEKPKNAHFKIGPFLGPLRSN